MGMDAYQQKLDAIGENLANSSTMGYKKINVGFKDLLSESLDRKGYPVNDRTAIMGTGVKTTEWSRDNSQGNLQETGISTDLCIDGAGNYFRLTNVDGSKVYTRDGSFKIDSTGTLVDANALKVDLEYVQGRNAENTKFKEENILIDNNGNVFLKEGELFNKVAKLNLYTATGNEAFKSIGQNLFVPGEGANVQVSDMSNVNINQGYLEGSNIDTATEMTDMIVTQRAFQLSSKSLQTADEMWGMINNIRS
jgi:flagellar basal-body rod protein FlgG